MSTSGTGRWILGLAAAGVALGATFFYNAGEDERRAAPTTPGSSALTLDEHIAEDTVSLSEAEEQALYQRILAEGIGVLDNRLRLSGDPKTKGYWEPAVNWPLIPMHATILHDGRLLAFDAAQEGPAVEQNALHNKTRVAIWDPATDSITRRDANRGYEMFCAGFSNLSNGDLFVAGGNANRSLGGINKTHVFDTDSDDWLLTNNMAFARWYTAVTPLSNGEMLITGGGPSTPEVRQNNGVIRRLNGASDSIWGNRAQHPWLQSAPGGGVYYLGPHDGMRWIDTNGSGRVQHKGARGGGQRTYGNMVMYEQGKLLVVGGGNKNSAMVIDINGASPSVRNTAAMAYRRTHHNSTLLADGTVLITGGNSRGGLVHMDAGVYEPELWDPATERWTRLAPMRFTRQYHSTALLLPDGRVFSGGGGLCGSCQVNGYHYLNSELFLPPYLFDKAGSGELADRPAILSAPSQVGYGQSVELQLQTDLPIEKLTFIRPGSTTHAINMEQRAVRAPFVDLGGGRIRWTTPANANVAPPGNYMLFAVDSDGVPSVARMVNVGQQDTRFDTLQLANAGFQKTSDQQVVELAVKGYSTAGLSLSYSVSGLPPGLEINRDSGVISGTPRVAGKYNTRVTVRDLAGRTQSVGFRWEVIAEPPTGEPLTDGLRGYWPVYDDKAQDLVGSSHGQAVGGLRFVSDDERGNVMRLDGSNDYLRINKRVERNSGSYSLWFKTSTPGRGLLSTTTANNGNDHDRDIVIEARGARAVLNGQAISGGTANYADDRWHHLMYTHGGDGQRLYIDGELIAQGSAERSSQSSPSQIQVGSSRSGGAGRFFQGQLDDLRYYQRQVPAAEVFLLSTGTRNQDPVLDTPADRDEEEGASVSLQLEASDPEGQHLRYAASGLPDGLRVDADTGRITGTLAQPGSYRVTATVRDSVGGSDSQLFNWVVRAVEQPNRAPVLTRPADQRDDAGDSVNLRLQASDADGDVLRFAISGLPDGLSLDSGSGRITGTLASAGNYTLTATVSDPDGASDSKGFAWRVDALASDLGEPRLTSANPPPVLQAGATASYTALATASTAVEYAWSFGDGSAQSAWSSGRSITHRFERAGRYQVSVLARDARGGRTSVQFTQVVHAALDAKAPISSTGLVLDEARDRVWVANPDNDTVTLIDQNRRTVVREVAVGDKPSAIALAANGDLWVSNKTSATLSVIDGTSLDVSRTVALPRASQPHGLLVVPESNAVYVALEATGEVLKLNAASGAVERRVSVAPRVRGLAIDADRSRVLVSRFVSPLLPGEDTGSIDTSRGGGEVFVLRADNLQRQRTVVLPVSLAGDSETSGNGLPNYLGAPAISPDGGSAWVPSKQDNIGRGLLRSGQPLDHQSTVRSVVSSISLGDWSAPWQQRVDLDNASLASAAAFEPLGNYLVVSLETSGELAVIDAHDRASLSRVKVGRAPVSVAVAADRRRAWVHNSVDRTVSVVDVGGVFDGTAATPEVLDTVSVVAIEALSAEVLLGKQLFHDAGDPRLAGEGYMSCASCHNDGDSDGRVWDFTQMGEGLRNTISLRGRGGEAHGKLHWAANFDELQDFEGQIREFAGGTGLMDDDDFENTRDAMGNPKVGLSADLDALAAYMQSLTRAPQSPSRADAYSAVAQRGRGLFNSAGCATCHSGVAMTDSATARRHDVGTLNAASGMRRGEALDGLDTPTLLGLHETGPYLHNGSAATIGDAIRAHNTHALSAAQIDDLQQYLLEIPAEGDDRAGTTELEHGVAVRGSVARDQWHYYTFDAGADVKAVRVVLSGLSADGDIYVRRGERPSGHYENGGVYDAVSNEGGTSVERVLVDNDGAGTWHIGVHGWRATDYTLVVSAEDVDEPGESRALVDGVAISDAVPKGQWLYFTIASTASHDRLVVRLDELSDDGDLYVRAGAKPSGHIDNDGVYDCHSAAGSTSAESCTLDNNEATLWHIGVYGYRGSTFRLQAELRERSGGGDGTLSPGAPVSDAVARGEWKYYTLSVPDEIAKVELRMEDLNADGDLYVRRGERPSGHVDEGGLYDCGSYRGGNGDEFCELDTRGGAELVVGVYGYRATDFVLKAVFHRTDSLTVSPIANGEAIDGSVGEGHWRYYRYTSSTAERQLRFSLSGLSADGDLYVRAGERPSGEAAKGANADCVSWRGGRSDEECVQGNDGEVTWYIGVYGYEASDFTVRVDASSTRSLANSKDYPVGKDVVTKAQPVVIGGSGGGAAGPGLLVLLWLGVWLRRRR